MKPFLLIFILFFTLGLTAQTGAPSDPPPQPAAGQAENADTPVPAYQQQPRELPTVNRTEMYTNMLGSLLLVVGLIMVLGYTAKRFFPNQLMGQMDGNGLRLLQTLPMGPKRAIALVEADGKRLLVGVTDNQINLIKSLDEVDFNQTLSDVEPPKTVGQLMGEELP